MNRPVNNLSILIAGDHEEVRRDIRTLLEQRREWRVCGEAATGGETIAMARTLCPDMLFLDLALSDMSAVDAIPVIKEVCPTVRIVVLAMRESVELAVRALAAGASGLAMISDTAKELLGAAQNTAKDRRFLSPAATRHVREYARKEMKRLLRERKHIDAAISDFERLEAQLPAKNERLRPFSDTKYENLIEMKRIPAWVSLESRGLTADDAVRIVMRATPEG
jgi:DNA-binding NarL/FixJ family response regulator